MTLLLDSPSTTIHGPPPVNDAEPRAEEGSGSSPEPSEPKGETLLPGDGSDDDVLELELVRPDPDDALPDVPTARGGWAATAAAAAFHAWLLLTLANIIVGNDLPPIEPPIESKMLEPQPQPDQPEKEPEYVLANPDDRELPVREVLNATSTGAAQTKQPEMLSPPEPPLEEIDPDRPRRPVFDIPEGLEIDETLVVQGTTGDSIVQIESALDRVTHEVAQNLKERKVLLIWLLDASGSLAEKREVIAGRLERIYGELDALERVGQIPRMQQPLLTAVAAFGQQTYYLTREPTDDFEEIRAAVAGVQNDPTGVENVFTTVRKVLGLWGKYRTERRIMLVVVTDESGDDFAALEPAVRTCRHYGARAYVIGPAAVFGRRKGFVPYKAEDGKTYQLPVDLGPETAVYEHVELPFWFDGPQYRYLSSGLGPYGLSRLVRETGGIYFTTDMITMHGLVPVGHFEGKALKPFEPDYRFGTPQVYQRHLREHPLRAALVTAARISRENTAEGTPALELRVNPNNYRQVAAEAQKTVARSELFLDEILRAFPPGIEKQLEHEASPRWRMQFCLTYGRLLALKVRCREYNAACAELKTGLSPQDVGSTANHWIFRPAGEINYATSMRRQAKLATSLLQRVVDEAPGTPFAVLAQRELKDGLGIRVIKRFIPPPPPPKPGGNASPPRRGLQLAPDPKPKPKPEPKPKPKPVVLPKL